MVHAYILIQTEVGKAAQVAATISEIGIIDLAVANSTTDNVRPTIVKDTVEEREMFAVERWN